MKNPNGYSGHHFFWERSAYRDRIGKSLATHLGSIALIPNELHFRGFPEAVHTLMQPPPRPEDIHILGAVALLDKQTDKFLKTPRAAIELVAEYFGHDRNEALANHLFQQLEIFGSEIL